MINPTGKKLQDLVSKMIDDEIEGVDKYTLNGSTWLIFTDQKRWVIEYTEDNILWYNYSFFTEIFDILSMKSTDSQNLIQEWFESRFLRPTVNDTRHYRHNEKSMVEHTIQNGVKDTSFVNPYFNQNVEETIQNGVKHTDFPFGLGDENAVEDAIQNGVKHTQMTPSALVNLVEDTIQNGVKHTFSSAVESWVLVEDTIQNGVKTKAALESHEGFMKGTPWVDKFFSKEDVEDTIQNGVKHTHKRLQQFPDNAIEAIQKGVKKTMHLDMDDDYVLVIEDTIQKGVKHTERGGAFKCLEGEGTIQNGVKEIGKKKTPDESFTNHIINNGVKQIHDDRSKNIDRVEGVIRIGEKLN